MKSQMIWTAVVLVLLNIIGFFALAMWWQNHHFKIVAVPVEVQADTTVATNTAGTNETNLVPSGTNGLAIINDVGGKVSFQQSSSRTSAPVAPENPHLK